MHAVTRCRTLVCNMKHAQYSQGRLEMCMPSCAAEMCCVDGTQMARQRMMQGGRGQVPAPSGHVHYAGTATTSDTAFRPQVCTETLSGCLDVFCLCESLQFQVKIIIKNLRLCKCFDDFRLRDFPKPNFRLKPKPKPSMRVHSHALKPL